MVYDSLLMIGDFVGDVGIVGGVGDVGVVSSVGVVDSVGGCMFSKTILLPSLLERGRGYSVTGNSMRYALMKGSRSPFITPSTSVVW